MRWRRTRRTCVALTLLSAEKTAGATLRHSSGSRIHQLGCAICSSRAHAELKVGASHSVTKPIGPPQHAR